MKAGAAIIPFLLLWPSGLPSATLYEGEKGALSLGGNYRNIILLLDYYDSSLFGTDFSAGNFSILRLNSSGNYRKRLYGEVIFKFDTIVNPSLGIEGATGNPFFQFSGYTGYSSFRIGEMGWDLLNGEGDDISLRAEFDRLNLSLELPILSVTLGRQAVTYGSAYLWNPHDLISPFSPFDLDMEYKRGVDGVKLEVPLGFAGGFEVIYASGKDFDFDESALLSRAFTTLKGFTAGLFGGRYLTDYVAGFDFSGEVLKWGVRGESLFHATEEGDDFWRACGGFDRLFPNELYLVFEYFYNGSGTNDPENYLEIIMDERFLRGETFSLSRHYAGFALTYPFLPVLKLSLGGVLNILDISSSLSTSLVYSISDEAEFLAGAIFMDGRRPDETGTIPAPRSEFGLYPDFYYMEMKFYF